jgi:hypothetical protein
VEHRVREIALPAQVDGPALSIERRSVAELMQTMMEVASMRIPPSPPQTGLGRRHHARAADRPPSAATSPRRPGRSSAPIPHLTVVLPGLS